MVSANLEKTVSCARMTAAEVSVVIPLQIQSAVLVERAQVVVLLLLGGSARRRLMVLTSQLNRREHLDVSTKMTSYLFNFRSYY